MLTWNRLRPCTRTIEGQQYIGLSIGGERTCHTIQGLNLCMDIGEAIPESTSISQVFLSHLHDDHHHMLKSHYLRRESASLPKASYFVWAPKVDALNTLFKVSRELVDYKGTTNNLPLVAYESDQEFHIQNNWTLRTYLMKHRISDHGFGLSEKRKRLRAEFRDQNIAQLIKQDPTIKPKLMEEVNFKAIFYSGDTSIEGLTDEILSYSSLILECTILGLEGDPEEKEIREGGHIHFQNLIDNLNAFKCNNLYLTHLSSRYKLETLDKEIPKLINQLREIKDINIEFLY